jgi:hypothetical protein
VTSAAGWHKQSVQTVEAIQTIEPSPQKIKFRKAYTMTSFDVPDIKWVERFIVGISSPDRYLTQQEIEKQMTAVNRALRYGKIISVEQNFTIISHGKKDILTQYTVYHVGFKSRPPGQ